MNAALHNLEQLTQYLIAFPDQLPKLLAEPERRLHQLIYDFNQLYKVIKAAPAQAEALLKPRVEGGLRHLIQNSSELADVIKAAPALAEVLLKSESEGGLRHLIEDGQQLAYVIKVAPDQAEALLKSEAEGGLLHLIQNGDQQIDDRWAGDLINMPALSLVLFTDAPESFIKNIKNAEDIIPLLAINPQLFPEFKEFSYLFHQPKDFLTYCHADIQYQLELEKEKALTETDPLVAIIDFRDRFNKVAEGITSKYFCFKALSSFIDENKQSHSASLLVAMILSDLSQGGIFCDPNHPAHNGFLSESEIEYQANRLIDAAGHAFKAISSHDTQLSMLASTLLFEIKMNLQTYLDYWRHLKSTTKSQAVPERIKCYLRKLESVSFDFMDQETQTRERPLPPIELVLGQPRVNSLGFFKEALYQEESSEDYIISLPISI